MTPKQKTRLWFVLALIVGVSAAAALVFKALGSNMLYFYSPAQVANGEAPIDKRFRVGGLVVAGSVERSKESLAVSFDITDKQSTMTVTFNGILPDLFREGQGIIAHGSMDEAGLFTAEKVLAKHDENYMPPEVADALKKQHGGVIPFGEAQRQAPSGSSENTYGTKAYKGEGYDAGGSDQ